jgi:hypothetical protein
MGEWVSEWVRHFNQFGLQQSLCKVYLSAGVPFPSMDILRKKYVKNFWELSSLIRVCIFKHCIFQHCKMHLTVLLYPDYHSTSCQFHGKKFWHTKKGGGFKGNTCGSRSLTLKLKERWAPFFFQTVSLYTLCYKSSYLLVSEYPWKRFEANSKEMGVMASEASYTPTWVSLCISWEINPKCSISKFSTISRTPMPTDLQQLRSIYGGLRTLYILPHMIRNWAMQNV